MSQKDAKGLMTGQATAFDYVVNGDGTKATTVTYPPTSYQSSWEGGVASAGTSLEAAGAADRANPARSFRGPVAHRRRDAAGCRAAQRERD